MRAFGPIKKEKFSNENNVTTENIIGNNISLVTGLENEKFSLVVELKEGVIEENIIQDCGKCDENFILPDTNIEYLSNHIDETRPNFRRSTVIENFVPESHGLSFKEGYPSLLNNTSYFVVEDFVVNWKSLDDELDLSFPEPSEALETTETPTETPTETANYYVVKEKRIRLFAVDCCDSEYAITDITLEALEKSSDSSLDNDLYETSYEIYSSEYDIDEIESDIVLPNFLPDPVVSRIHPPALSSYTVSFGGLSVDSSGYDPSLPLYQDGPNSNEIVSILSGGVQCEATGSFPDGLYLAGSVPLSNNGRIDVSAVISEGFAQASFTVFNHGQPIASGGDGTLTVVAVGGTFSTVQGINTQNLSLPLAGSTIGYLNYAFNVQSTTANVSAINPSNEEDRREALTRIAENYATRYGGVVKNTLFNTGGFGLQFNKDFSNARLREVIGELFTDDRIEYVDTSSYISSISSKPRLITSRQGTQSVAGISMPNMGRASQLRPMTLTSGQQNPATTYLWNLDRINQRNLPLDKNISNYPDGSDAVVYVFDTGVDINHPEFEGRARFGYSAYGPRDVYGHGTHVAGTIAGKNVGIAKKAQIVSVKVLSDNGSGSLWGLLDGIDWAIEDIKQQKLLNPNKIFIANFSLGFSVPIRFVDIYIEKLAKYAEVVCAAGNGASGPYGGSGWGPGSPGSSWGAYAIGATAGGQTDKPDNKLYDWGQKADEFAWFTNYGPKVVLYAPGISIFSCLPNNKYRYWAGTSMSCPLAAGALALDPYIFMNATDGVLTCNTFRLGTGFNEFVAPLCFSIQKMGNKLAAKQGPNNPEGGMLSPMPRLGQWNKLLFTDGIIRPPS
jgi:subtilisin family serine protease